VEVLFNTAANLEAAASPMELSLRSSERTGVNEMVARASANFEAPPANMLRRYKDTTPSKGLPVA